MCFFVVVVVVVVDVFCRFFVLTFVVVVVVVDDDDDDDDDGDDNDGNHAFSYGAGNTVRGGKKNWHCSRHGMGKNICAYTPRLSKGADTLAVFPTKKSDPYGRLTMSCQLD